MREVWSVDQNGRSFLPETERTWMAHDIISHNMLELFRSHEVVVSTSKPPKYKRDTLTGYTILGGTIQSKRLGVRRYDKINSQELDLLLDVSSAISSSLFLISLSVDNS
jgi:hypothetical protein